MSTLLDLKSSMLRQVQRSQSLRARREPPASTSAGGSPPTLARRSGTIVHRVARGNGEFFDRMNKILQKQDSLLSAGQTEVTTFFKKTASLLLPRCIPVTTFPCVLKNQEESSCAPPPPECKDQAFVPERSTRDELDLLYEEAIYTMVSRVGVPSPEYVTNEGDIFNYLQKVFDMGQEEHDIILQRVRESKKASFSLRVSVMKGKNLMAKDANGYSDPYCMLGILLGQSPKDTEEKKERKFSFRKRREKLEKRSSVKEVLAGRDIQVTEVKPETLNPVWNEHFVFDIDDVHNDLLHLDIWDHDDDVSVAEACKKLNEISGFRGMGRYFKQIAKSVRSNGAAASGSEENADDFLGCINIPLNRDTALSKMASNVSIHKKMLSQILDYEHNQIQKEPFNWNGQVCAAAWTVLSHHAVQADLSPLQQAIIRWQCYSSHHRSQRMSYALLLRLLKTVEAEWEDTAVHGELTLEEQLRRLVMVVDAVCVDVQRGQNVYNTLYYSSVKVDFFSISYRQLEKLVADDVNVAMERVCGNLEQESSRLTQTMGETLFELFMSLKSLKRFREFLPLKDTKMLALTGFHNWFKTSIHKWLQIVHEKSTDRIRKAVEMDQLEPIQRQAKHSSSAVDVTTCFTQVQEFWAQLAWPDSAGAFIFITRLTDNFCSEAVCYAELIKRKIERGQLGRDHKSFIMQVCVALNSTEHVRVYLGGLPRELDWRGVEQAMEESCGLEGKEQVNKSLNGQLYNADIDLQREAKRLIAHLTDKAVAPLMKYLDDTLVILNESLVKENLTRVLQSLWELLLRMIMDTVVENRGVQVEFYTRFQYTVETLVRFFHADGEGMLLEDLKSGDYKALDEELRLNKCSSFELIEQYFLEKISQQRILKHSRFGRISVKCYYDAPEQRLTVEILHAADLIALDANGLSDPFVIVELCPHHLFPTARSQRTQVKLKTLHPVFDELFYFHVSPEQYRHRCACLTFTVMDYDWLSTNDFAGEAVAPLSDFCWPGRPSATPAGKTLQPVILHLSRQKPSEKPIMKMLEARTANREAQEFVRKLKEIEKSMEEE
ncbi:hypothetical protein cypCar_00014022 [Cyprinus carpio]|nr:hypothetical protein cypCar_00014022 [Cyprinus carpio]